MEQKVQSELCPLTNLLTIVLQPKELLCNLKIKVFVALSQILRVQSLFNAQDFFYFYYLVRILTVLNYVVRYILLAYSFEVVFKDARTFFIPVTEMLEVLRIVVRIYISVPVFPIDGSFFLYFVFVVRDYFV